MRVKNGLAEYAARARKLAEPLFFLGYVSWLLWKVQCLTFLSFPEGSPINTLIHFSLLVVLSIPAFLLVGRDARTAMAVALFALGIAVWRMSGEFSLVDLAVLLQASRSTSFDRIVRVSFCVVGLASLLVVLLALAGVIPNHPFTRGDRIRFGLGFLYSTFAPLLYLYLMLSYLYIRREQITAWELLGAFVVNILLFVATDSRNPFILTMLIIVGGVAYRAGILLGTAPRRLLGLLAEWSPVVLTAVFLVISLAYTPMNPLFERANTLLSGRLAYTNASLATYGITPFGQETDWVTNVMVATDDGFSLHSETELEADRNYVDNSYINILITKGVLAFTVTLSVFTLAGRWARTRGDLILCLILLIIAVHSTIDTQLLDVTFNPFVFFAWDAAAEKLDKLYLKSRLMTKASRN